MKKLSVGLLALMLALLLSVGAVAEEIAAEPVEVVAEEAEQELWSEEMSEAAEKAEPAEPEQDGNTIIDDPNGSTIINETTFPDERFRGYVMENFDKNGNAKLSTSEKEAVTKIDCSDMGITSLKGIGYFTELKTLVCCSNDLASLSVKKNTKLRRISS